MNRPRFSLGRLMIAVAIVSPFLLVLRDDLKGGEVAGALIVGACVLVLAGKLAIDDIRRESAAGRPVGWWKKVGIWLHGLAVALLIIGIADFTFLFVSSLVATGRLHGIELPSLLAGTLAAVFLARFIRRTFLERPPVPPPSEAKDRLPPEIDPKERT